jgi:hypothetical protein
MENQIDITKLSITELKALAFDLLIIVQNTQNNLNLINQEIEKRNVQTNETKEKPEKTK